MGQKWKKEIIAKWVGELGITNQYIEVEKEDGGDPVFRIRIFTKDHKYSIAAYDGKGKSSKSYLGCICYNRRSLAGESWNRCKDLNDGPLTKSTWERIKGDIIATELVRLGE